MMLNGENAICTIIAKNYISFARTLCKSFLDQHPDGKCYVLIIDEFEGYLNPENEIFEIIKLEELNIRNLRDMCFRYDILELATATKPYLLKYLIDSKQITKICYFDPDILITNRIDNVYKELEECDFVITPHLDKDYPDDDALPDDAAIMRHGIFNLGFIGVRRSEGTDQFLLWWQHKLYNKCLRDYEKGYYVDQKFIDLAITLFGNYKIMHDTGYNVAYWNLHSRTVDYIQGTWRCNNGELYFYHFSSYKPEKPAEISLKQTRYLLKDMSALNMLFDTYNSLLIQNGYYDSHTWPYTYNSFKNGKQIAKIIKKLYRKNIIYKEDMDPFDIDRYPVRFRWAMQGVETFDKGALAVYKFIMNINKMLKNHGK